MHPNFHLIANKIILPLSVFFFITNQLSIPHTSQIYLSKLFLPPNSNNVLTYPQSLKQWLSAYLFGMNVAELKDKVDPNLLESCLPLTGILKNIDNRLFIKDIGQGGQGAVKLEKLVENFDGLFPTVVSKYALDKILNIKDVINEIAILKYLKRLPNVVPMIGVSTRKENNEKLFELPALIMAQAETALDSIFNKNPVLNWDTLFDVILQLLNGYNVMHKLNIVHRDIKTQNILISKTGEIWVNDFGLAKYIDKNNVKQDYWFGTAQYTAPEHLLKEIISKIKDTVDFPKKQRQELIKNTVESWKANDSWGVGVLIYWLLTKSYPFIGDRNLPFFKREKVQNDYKFKLKTIWTDIEQRYEEINLEILLKRIIIQKGYPKNEEEGGTFYIALKKVFDAEIGVLELQGKTKNNKTVGEELLKKIFPRQYKLESSNQERFSCPDINFDYNNFDQQYKELCIIIKVVEGLLNINPEKRLTIPTAINYLCDSLTLNNKFYDPIHRYRYYNNYYNIKDNILTAEPLPQVLLPPSVIAAATAASAVAAPVAASVDAAAAAVRPLLPASAAAGIDIKRSPAIVQYNEIEKNVLFWNKYFTRAKDIYSPQIPYTILDRTFIYFTYYINKIYILNKKYTLKQVGNIAYFLAMILLDTEYSGSLSTTMSYDIFSNTTKEDDNPASKYRKKLFEQRVFGVFNRVKGVFGGPKEDEIPTDFLEGMTKDNRFELLNLFLTSEIEFLGETIYDKMINAGIESKVAGQINTFCFKEGIYNKFPTDPLFVVPFFKLYIITIMLKSLYKIDSEFQENSEPGMRYYTVTEILHEKLNIYEGERYNYLSQIDNGDTFPGNIDIFVSEITDTEASIILSKLSTVRIPIIKTDLIESYDKFPQMINNNNFGQFLTNYKNNNLNVYQTCLTAKIKYLLETLSVEDLVICVLGNDNHPNIPSFKGDFLIQKEINAIDEAIAQATINNSLTREQLLLMIKEIIDAAKEARTQAGPRIFIIPSLRVPMPQITRSPLFRTVEQVEDPESSLREKDPHTVATAATTRPRSSSVSNKVENCNAAYGELLLCAISSRKEDKAIEYLNKNPDLTVKDDEGHTALALACKNNLPAVALQILNNPIVTANHAPYINTANTKGITPLMLASAGDLTNIVRNLLAKGADINAVDKENKTAFYYACQNKKENTALVLLKTNKIDHTKGIKISDESFLVKISAKLESEDPDENLSGFNTEPPIQKTRVANFRSGAEERVPPPRAAPVPAPVLNSLDTLEANIQAPVREFLAGPSIDALNTLIGTLYQNVKVEPLSMSPPLSDLNKNAPDAEKLSTVFKFDRYFALPNGDCGVHALLEATCENFRENTAENRKIFAQLCRTHIFPHLLTNTKEQLRKFYPAPENFEDKFNRVVNNFMELNLPGIEKYIYTETLEMLCKTLNISVLFLQNAYIGEVNGVMTPVQSAVQLWNDSEENEKYYLLLAIGGGHYEPMKYEENFYVLREVALNLHTQWDTLQNAIAVEAWPPGTPVKRKDSDQLYYVAYEQKGKDVLIKAKSTEFAISWYIITTDCNKVRLANATGQNYAYITEDNPAWNNLKAEYVSNVGFERKLRTQLVKVSDPSCEAANSSSGSSPPPSSNIGGAGAEAAAAHVSSSPSLGSDVNSTRPSGNQTQVHPPVIAATLNTPRNRGNLAAQFAGPQKSESLQNRVAKIKAAARAQASTEFKPENAAESKEEEFFDAVNDDSMVGGSRHRRHSHKNRLLRKRNSTFKKVLNPSTRRTVKRTK